MNASLIRFVFTFMFLMLAFNYSKQNLFVDVLTYLSNTNNRAVRLLGHGQLELRSNLQNNLTMGNANSIFNELDHLIRFLNNVNHYLGLDFIFKYQEYFTSDRCHI